MSEPTEYLLSCLTEKELLLEKLVLLLDVEQGHIVGLDTEGVESSRQGKLQLLEHLESKTAECRTALEVAADDLKVSPAGNLSAVISALKSPVRDNLANIQQRLLNLGEAVVRINRSNRDLLYGSLRAVNSSLEYYNRSFGKSCTYCDKGRMDSGIAGVRLLSGEI